MRAYCTGINCLFLLNLGNKMRTQKVTPQVGQKYRSNLLEATSSGGWKSGERNQRAFPLFLWTMCSIVTRAPGRNVLGSRPGPATILLRSNIGQVVYSHCLSSLLTSEKLGTTREYSDWTDLTA